MSENEPLINFNCPCGKPVAAPASLAGQKLHCPYAGCETIITAPAAEAAAPATEAAKPADGKPKQPRMPPPKGMKGGKGPAPVTPRKKPAPGPAAAGTAPAADKSTAPETPVSAAEGAPASGTPASDTPAAPPKKKKNALFFAACSAVTAGVLFVMTKGGDKPAPKVVTVVQPPAPAPKPAKEAPPPPSTPAPPLENGARKPRQQMSAEEIEALNARLAGGVQEKKKQQDAAFQKLVAAAEGGGLEAIFDLADAYAQGKGTEVNPEKARELLLKATEKHSSKAWYKLGELEEHRSADKAAEYFLKGAKLVAESKAETRGEKLQHYAKRLRDLGADKQAAEVEALLGKPAKQDPVAPVPAPAAPEAAAPAAPASPEPAPAAPAIPEPAAPAIPEPAAPGIPEPAAPAIPEPAPPPIPEP